jgi:hypothetical protein
MLFQYYVHVRYNFIDAMISEEINKLKTKLQLDYSLEWLATLVSLLALVSSFYTFVIGQHYIIPTMSLIPACVFANLAYYGFQDQRWARLILFWMFSILAAHFFMALFWAQTPREVLGSAFVPIYIAAFAFFCAIVFGSRKRLYSHTTQKNLKP